MYNFTDFLFQQNMKTDSSNASIISDEQVPMSEPRMATMTKLARRNPATTKPGNAPFSYPGTTMSALGKSVHHRMLWVWRHQRPNSKSHC